MRHCLAPFVLIVSGLAAPPAQAALCVADVAPAASLLVPYFEAAGDRSRLSRVDVANTTEVPVVAQFTVWTDGGQPLVTFPVYLAGHARWRIDLQAFVMSGEIPRSSPSSLATFSTTTSNPPNCTSAIFAQRNIAPAELLRMRQALMGAVNDQGVCGFPYGDQVARGYVTIDARAGCTTLLPNDPAYYTGISYANVLAGTFELVRGPNHALTSSAAHAVALEADASGTVVAPGDRTFYREFSGGADRREPLPTRWQVDRAPAAAASVTTSEELIAWRQGPARPNLCSAGMPLGHGVAEPVQFIDAAGNATGWPAPASPTLASPFALATRAIPVATAFPQAMSYVRADVRLLDDPEISGQGWVGLRSFFGEIDTLQPGRPRDGNCRAQTITRTVAPQATGPIPRLDVVEFLDSFESTDGE